MLRLGSAKNPSGFYIQLAKLCLKFKDKFGSRIFKSKSEN